MPGFAIQHRVPWPDVDMVGVVYFPRFLSYFELAEVEWMRRQGVDYERLLGQLNVWLPRVAAHCDYHAPARLSDLLSIEMQLDRLGRTSFTLGYQALLLPERRLLANGYITAAVVSRSTFKPVRIPRELRAALAGLEESDKISGTTA